MLKANEVIHFLKRFKFAAFWAKRDQNGSAIRFLNIFRKYALNFWVELTEFLFFY